MAAMKMTMKDGKSVPFFAADGKGKMKNGGKVGAKKMAMGGKVAAKAKPKISKGGKMGMGGKMGKSSY